MFLFCYFYKKKRRETSDILVGEDDSLIIQENADPSVQLDLIEFFNNTAPESRTYKHKFEGQDDMPAHIKSSLTNTSLSLSIQSGSLLLGEWQAIYLFEHRKVAQSRKINLHFIGTKKI